MSFSIGALRRSNHENPLLSRHRYGTHRVFGRIHSGNNLVSMTIEHAKEKANISEVSYLQMEKIVA